MRGKARRCRRLRRVWRQRCVRLLFLGVTSENAGWGGRGGNFKLSKTDGADTDWRFRLGISLEFVGDWDA